MQQLSYLIYIKLEEEEVSLNPLSVNTNKLNKITEQAGCSCDFSFLILMLLSNENTTQQSCGFSLL